MVKVVGEIAIEVGANISALVREMGKANAAVGAFSTRASAALDRFAGRTRDLGAKLSYVSAGIAAAGAAAFTMVKSSADAADAMGNMAKEAGVSAEYFQEMRFAMEQAADMTSEDLAKSMAFFTRTLGDAVSGTSSAVKAFERIGITQADLASGAVTTEQAFDKLVETLSATTDPALAASIAADLLGKTGASMGTQLAGAEGSVDALRARARELGVVLSDETIEAAAEFGDKWDEVKAQFSAVRLAIGASLLPALNWIFDNLNEVVFPAMREFGPVIDEVVAFFTGMPEPVQQALGVVAGALAVGGPVMMAIAGFSAALSALIAATGPVGLFIAAAGLAYAAWKTWGDDITAVVQSVAGAFERVFTAIGGFIQGAIDKATALIEKIKEILGFNMSGLADDGFIPGGYSGGAGGSLGGAGLVRPQPVPPMSGTGGGNAIGEEIGNGLVDGVKGSLVERMPELDAAFMAIPERARQILEIQSPSQVFRRIGGYLGEGMAQGIEESSDMVRQAVEGMGGQAKAAADATTGDVLNAMGNLFQGSKKISAGIALANSWLAFTEVLKDPAYIGRPWARFAAAAGALSAGLNAVRSINAAQPGGGGSAASGAAPGGTGAGGGQAGTFANITLVGDTHSTASVRALMEAISREIENGGRLAGIRVA